MVLPRALVPALLLCALARAQDPPPAPAWGPPEKVCELQDERIHESSGLAAGRALEGLFWTHNDSGDGPRLFVVDREGRTRATFQVEGARAKDWEDVCAFRWKERAWVLVGDTGDNKSTRAEVALYLLEEPRSLPPADWNQRGPDPAGAAEAQLPVRAALRVRYEDGPHDCEGLAVDGTSGTALLVTKERRGGKPAAYALELVDAAPDEPIVAKKLADLAAPGLTTALDVSPDGRVAVVATYGDAYVWSRAEGQGWAEAFARAPVVVELPPRRQGESVCFDAGDGRTLWLTSEGLPAPLWRLPVR